MTDGAGWWVLIGAIAGLIAGSFVATLVIRWPRQLTLHGRSACDACARPLSPRDLVPLLSWASTLGKCRTCTAQIDWRHPAIETAAAFVGATAMFASPGMAGAIGALFGWQLLALAALDAEHFWLPDRLTVTLGLTGLAVGVAGVGVDLTARVIGGVAGFAILSAIAWTYHRVRGRVGMGGGDPKLLGAIGCWMGWHALPFVLLGASLAGLLATVAMIARGQPVATTTRLPLGAFMAIAAFPLWIILSQR